MVANSSPADIPVTMIRAMGRRPSNLNAGARWGWYMPPIIKTGLELQARTAAVNTITYENFDGRQITSFGGIPINTVDQLLTTEARLT
jgi:hypothetical protein